MNREVEEFYMQMQQSMPHGYGDPYRRSRGRDWCRIGAVLAPPRRPRRSRRQRQLTHVLRATAARAHVAAIDMSRARIRAVRCRQWIQRNAKEDFVVHVELLLGRRFHAEHEHGQDHEEHRGPDGVGLGLAR